MQTSTDFINVLSLQGYKKTKVREAIIERLQALKKPLDASAIRMFLEKHGLAVNKSTVYRELEFLLARAIIVEIHFGDGKKRYEISGLPHHHHAVCNKCHKIEDVFIEKDLVDIEKKIRKEKSFVIQNHSLEFFGLCKSCV